MLKKFFISFFLFTASLLLVSCGCNPCPTNQPRATHPCDDLIYSLNQQGVTTIRRGDTLRMILPVDLFFYPATTKIKPETVPLLQTVAALSLCYCYQFSSMRVYGYTDNIGTIKEQQQRSLLQARNIAAHLWNNGVPLSRMIIRGFGARGTLSSNSTPQGEADNRRVEVLIP